jgi:hypothetical protein
MNRVTLFALLLVSVGCVYDADRRLAWHGAHNAGMAARVLSTVTETASPEAVALLRHYVARTASATAQLSARLGTPEPAPAVEDFDADMAAPKPLPLAVLIIGGTILALGGFAARSFGVPGPIVDFALSMGGKLLGNRAPIPPIASPETHGNGDRRRARRASVR